MINEPQDPVAIAQRMVDVMRGEDNRDAVLPREIKKQLHNVLSCRRIERGAGLVGDQDFGFADDCAGDRDTLRLAS